MRMLFLGDIFGRPGRSIVFERLRQVRRDWNVARVVANAENASGGIGLNAKAARQLLDAGIDVMTGGNHIFRNADITPFLETTDRLLRPANYPAGAPGAGWAVYRPKDGPPYAVINLLGRTFMPAVDCPFASADAILAGLPGDVTLRLVDFHAEATSEKKAMGYYLDGRVSAVLGTHTHVQTADAQHLPRGTAYMTDIGMTGPAASCLGMDPEEVIARFRTGLPRRFVVSRAAPEMQGALLDIDAATGKVVTISGWRLA
ncbi:TIGR00282 family metallophosphoesterase [Desulfovibrio sp. TomC]|uniref:TIGR00282 family metallophosphoesterase n=1 Tax=Desulfovibrio sp. TomC TaxID=1562888 RepID=UPI00057552EE|nr:TIGR00282 family metallophosphoesterase [Desulfovibrio sp. TomC]KHK02001.1 Phosphoesterase family protein [Desulfovibrio sp. TomC]